MSSILIFLIGWNIFAATSAPLGVYSGAPVTRDSVAFELLKNGKAVVTSDYYGKNRTLNKTPKNKVYGSWTYNDPYLEISYGKHKDRLMREDCSKNPPCFKYEKSYGGGLSPLNVPYGFGRWESK